MKRIALLFTALAVITSVSSAQVPRGVLAEDCTVTSCSSCADSYTGLEVMKSVYDATEFMAVRYYDTSGDLGNAETEARIGTYYGVTTFPTVLIGGATPVAGGGSAVAGGYAYDPLVAGELSNPSPLKIRINRLSLTAPTGSIDCDVEAVMNIFDVSHLRIRIALLEDSVDWNGEIMQDVTRDLLPDVNLTVSHIGQVQNVVQEFPVDSTWKAEDLWMVVFVQSDLGKTVIQATNSRPPVYAPRYWALAPRGVFLPVDSGLHEFPNFAVYNMGTARDVIHVALQTGSVPAGWRCVFTDGKNDYPTSTDLDLRPGEGSVFHLKVDVAGSGYLNPKIVISTDNLPGRIREIPYAVVTGGTQMLVVDDDGGQSYETAHTDALDAAGVTYAVWPTTAAEVNTDLLAAFGMVDWETGRTFRTLTDWDQAALSAYLDDGGKLLISGTDIGADLAGMGGDPLWWYNHYLHAGFLQDDTGSNTVGGIAGDPITDGMTLDLTPGLNPSPDEIAPFDSTATHIFVYDPPGGPGEAGLKVDTGQYKLVYLAFELESITLDSDRDLLVQRVVDWLQAASSAPEPSARLTETRVRVAPNPARGGTDLRYVLPKSGDVRVDIYGPGGSLVRRLSEGSQPAGAHTLRWDGRDDGGGAVPPGVYFYRLCTGSAGRSGKLVVTR
jgi:hypothetical protein